MPRLPPSCKQQHSSGMVSSKSSWCVDLCHHLSSPTELMVLPTPRHANAHDMPSCKVDAPADRKTIKYQGRALVESTCSSGFQPVARYDSRLPSASR